MKKIILGLAAASSMLLMPGEQAHAEGEFHGNVTVTTDYLFRGVTQTGGDPAIQGELGWAHESGFYLGTWASTIDFGDDGGDLEWDFYAGYDYEFNPGSTLHLTANYYTYHGLEFSGANYLELIVGLSQEFDGATVGVNFEHAPKYFGESTRQNYFKLHSSVPLAENWVLDAHIGRVNFSDNALAAQPDTTDWQIGVSYMHGAWTVTAAFADTDWSALGSDANNNFFVSAGFDF